MRLGVCYYPEHWPEQRWAEDAARMVAMGISRVRIGEFAWSRIEPVLARYDWHWLDRAISVLADAGLEIILGTPTATPPKWLVDRMPDMLAVDSQGHQRRFGSRRHYCFSHNGYATECARIVAALAHRYGDHAAIVAWQIDNEYGCHDTAVSYSASAAAAFRHWLERRHGTIAALNAAWGTVFWSQEYRSFAEVDLPLLTVTEPNPAHVLDFRRFSSDQVVAFNAAQAAILRAASPGRDIVHNFMGFFTQFDHHAVSRDLDVATWDSYPLGFLDQFSLFTADDKLRYARTGHPDIAAFHHDLYRDCAGGRWWVMEQQPGPVNWAGHNPAPANGMVRLWTLEAMAHGAELVSYFRWRQFPQAQEQMHAGLLRPDNAEAPGAAEVRQTASDIAMLGECGSRAASVALVFSYEAAWVFETQPQGRSFDYLALGFAFYAALRRLALDVDIVAPDADLSGYRMIVVPSLPIIDDAFIAKIGNLGVPVLFGPRSGSKTHDFAIPDGLPLGPLQSLLPLQVTHVESLRAGLMHAGQGFAVERWLEHVETALEPEIALVDGTGLVFAANHVRYLAAWPDAPLLARLFSTMAREAELPTSDLPPDVRVRRLGERTFAFNYGPQAIALDALVPAGATIELGARTIEPAGVTVWR